jgi:hypothetical protein
MELLSELLGIQSLFKKKTKDEGNIYSREKVQVDVRDITARIEAVTRALSAANKLSGSKRNQHLLQIATNLETIAKAIKKSAS